MLRATSGLWALTAPRSIWHVKPSCTTLGYGICARLQWEPSGEDSLAAHWQGFIKVKFTIKRQVKYLSWYPVGAVQAEPWQVLWAHYRAWSNSARSAEAIGVLGVPRTCFRNCWYTLWKKGEQLWLYFVAQKVRRITDRRPVSNTISGETGAP